MAFELFVIQNKKNRKCNAIYISPQSLYMTRSVLPKPEGLVGYVFCLTITIAYYMKYIT